MSISSRVVKLGFSHNRSSIVKNRILNRSSKPTSKDLRIVTVRCADMSAWNELYVPSPVLRGLAELRFTAPTPIQALCLAPAIRDRLDIVGAAETVRCNVIISLQNDEFTDCRLLMIVN